MLILPLDRAIDWRRPPVLIFCLLTLNVAIYFGFQLDDRLQMAAAFEWYHEAGPAEIELPRYRGWLIDQGERAFVERYEDELLEPGSPWLGRMLGDGEFQQALAAGRIVEPDEPIYSQWRAQHREFHERLERSTTMAWGLRPANPEVATWLAHMYLHGSVLHLIGNMVFLVAVGFLVEMALGALVLLGLYTLAGLGAAALFVFLNPNEGLPLVGASGAIAGLMGLLAVIYGMQRIRFFYFIGVYFDYVKAPAIVLLPLWLGYELYQYVAAAEWNPVAYSAHIGGLVTGAAAAAGIRWGTNLIDYDEVARREREERLQCDLEEVREAVQQLRPDVARPALRRLQAQAPADCRVLQAAWDVARMEPTREEIHTAAHAIFQVEGDTADTRDWIVATWRDYQARARPRPRLPALVVERLADVLLSAGELAEAEQMVAMLAKRPTQFPHAAEFACRLAAGLMRQQRHEAAVRWYRLVSKQWPKSAAARTAARALEQI